jgi:hypothetical protein
MAIARRPSRLCVPAIVLAIVCLSCGLCAPQPFLSSVSPNNAAAGGNQFVLTVNGSNFRPDSLVSWNGSFRLTTFVGSHQLVVAVSAADIVAPGQVLVLVFKPQERGTTSVSGAIGNTASTPWGGGNSGRCHSPSVTETHPSNNRTKEGAVRENRVKPRQFRRGRLGVNADPPLSSTSGDQRGSETRQSLHARGEAGPSWFR